jgi:hypothetical protein
MQPRLGLRAFLVVACGAALHCGGGAGPGAAGPAHSPEQGPSAALTDATVFDARGTKQTCAAPREDCGQDRTDRDFLDQCSLHGYQVRRCGCNSLCTGDVSGAKRHYDAAGNAKDCAPAKPDCTMAPVATRFQDACSEKGFKMSQCGCEWLCSGNVAK